VHQAGSYVGPDKLRFDFTHASSLSADHVAEIERQVNAWILESQPVRAITTTLTEAKELGAMALFGEKYGDVVRMVEVGDGSFSRELCGGTHVRMTSEIGLFKILSETSSAANVRRIEAVTGPEAVHLVRRHDSELGRAADTLRVPPERVADTVLELRNRVRELERAAKQGGGQGAVDIDQLAGSAAETDGVPVLVSEVRVPDGKALLDVADRLKNKLGDAVIVLAAAGEDRVDLVASVAAGLVPRGLKAGDLVKAAAAAVGGGGGGRDTLARAGGRDVENLPKALEVARSAIERALAG
jgi:alanyl-tRNA synthetase